METGNIWQCWGYRKKWTSIFGIIWYFVPVCDGLWLGPKSDGKASSNRQHGWAWIRGAEPEYWVWMAGHHLQNGYGPSRFIKQSDWVGMFQQDTYNYWRLMNTIEPSWTTWSRVWSRVFCGSSTSDGGGTNNHWDSFRFTSEPPGCVGHFGRAIVPNLFPRVSLVLVAPRIPSIRNLDTGYHGFVGALAMPLNLQISRLNQVEASRVWYIQCIYLM